MNEIDREVWRQELREIEAAKAKTCRECRKCRVFSEGGIELGFCLECEEFLSDFELDTTIYNACGEEPCD